MASFIVILIAVVDGLKGFPEAITAAFPEAMVQTCYRALGVSLLEFLFLEGSHIRGGQSALDLYEAATADQAADGLDAFEENGPRNTPPSPLFGGRRGGK